MTVACQALLSMEFSRPEYWSGLPFPSPGDRPNPGIEPRSPTLQVASLPSEPPGKPRIHPKLCKYQEVWDFAMMMTKMLGPVFISCHFYPNDSTSMTLIVVFPWWGTYNQHNWSARVQGGREVEYRYNFWDNQITHTQLKSFASYCLHCTSNPTLRCSAAGIVLSMSIWPWVLLVEMTLDSHLPGFPSCLYHWPALCLEQASYHLETAFPPF